MEVDISIQVGEKMWEEREREERQGEVVGVSGFEQKREKYWGRNNYGMNLAITNKPKFPYLMVICTFIDIFFAVENA